MLGVVLCGGLSSRMGSDKGLLLQGARSWAQLAADKFEALGIPCCISINQRQSNDYSNYFPTDQLMIDDPAISVNGPLLGLLSIHKTFITENIFALACDLPLMELTIMKKLVRSVDANPGKDAYLFLNEGQSEPLCSIYSSEALRRAGAMLDEGKLVKFGLRYLLDQLQVHAIDLGEEEKICFKNFNSPESI